MNVCVLNLAWYVYMNDYLSIYLSIYVRMYLCTYVPMYLWSCVLISFVWCGHNNDPDCTWPWFGAGKSFTSNVNWFPCSFFVNHRDWAAQNWRYPVLFLQHDWFEQTFFLDTFLDNPPSFLVAPPTWSGPTFQPTHFLRGTNKNHPRTDADAGSNR